MKAYSGFSRIDGPIEGAVLVFANSAKEARKLAYGHCLNVDEWTDQAVKWIKDDDTIFGLANQQKLNDSIPHVVDCPIDCESCEEWGWGITADNKCCGCGEYPGDDLVRALTMRLSRANKPG